MKKSKFLFINLLFFCICLLSAICLMECEHKHYEKLFLSQIGYLMDYPDQSVETYLNQNFQSDNKYQKQGLNEVQQSSYQNSYLYFLNKNIKDMDIMIMIIFSSLYLFVSMMMLLYDKFFKDYQKQIVTNLHYSEDNQVITINDHLLYEFQKHQQYIQYQIQKISKEKDFMYQFIIDVTHQLKTPMSALSLMVEHQKYENNPHLEEIEKQIYKINDVISKLLNQGKLEAGRMEIHIERNCLVELIDDIENDLKEILAYHQIELQIECDVEVGYYDAYWLKEAIVNILKNCIEHSLSSQRIQLLIRGNQNIIITIQDWAGGIEDSQHIFERYYTNDYQKGTGLGMYLSHLIVMKHFGSIKVENTAEGSLFTIILPHQLIV